MTFQFENTTYDVDDHALEGWARLSDGRLVGFDPAGKPYVLIDLFVGTPITKVVEPPPGKVVVSMPPGFYLFDVKVAKEPDLQRRRSRLELSNVGGVYNLPTWTTCVATAEGGVQVLVLKPHHREAEIVTLQPNATRVYGAEVTEAEVA